MLLCILAYLSFQDMLAEFLIDYSEHVSKPRLRPFAFELVTVLHAPA